MKLTIRPEDPRDRDGIRAVNLAAFESPVEADLVDRLRQSSADNLSLVALDSERVVGYVLFTPAVLECGTEALKGMALGPMAVLPEFQKRGIGTALSELGVVLLRRRSCPYVVVLGHPGYYPRFGFETSVNRGITCPWPGLKPEVFMVLVLDEAAMAGKKGVVRYSAEFNSAV